jgi:hypothetical protein
MHLSYKANFWSNNAVYSYEACDVCLSKMSTSELWVLDHPPIHILSLLHFTLQKAASERAREQPARQAQACLCRVANSNIRPPPTENNIFQEYAKTSTSCCFWILHGWPKVIDRISEGSQVKIYTFWVVCHQVSWDTSMFAQKVQDSLTNGNSAIMLWQPASKTEKARSRMRERLSQFKEFFSLILNRRSSWVWDSWLRAVAVFNRRSDVT